VIFVVYWLAEPGEQLWLASRVKGKAMGPRGGGRPRDFEFAAKRGLALEMITNAAAAGRR
jgi:hypothetical protein